MPSPLPPCHIVTSPPPPPGLSSSPAVTSSLRMNAIRDGNAIAILSFVVPTAFSFSSFMSPWVRTPHTRSIAAASQDASVEGTAFQSDATPGTRDLLRSSALESPSTSLISYANIQKAFNGEALTSLDHYEILGLERNASYQEVETAFKRRCERLLQQDLSEQEIRKNLRLLKASHDILSSEEERRIYDWSLLQQIRVPKDIYAWPFEADITQRQIGPCPPEKPADEEAIRRVRNFFIGWFVLSVFLNLFLR